MDNFLKWGAATFLALTVFSACDKDSTGAGDKPLDGDSVGGAGGQAPDQLDCSDELTFALEVVKDNASCESAKDCVLVLTESATMSELLAANDSGYLFVHTDADLSAVQQAARSLSACEGGFGPSGVGHDLESLPAECTAGICGPRSSN